MFKDQSQLLRDNPFQMNYGVAVTDIDGDGQFECMVAGFGFPNLVLKWQDGGFVNIADEALADATRQAIGLAACDIDGDGMEEIYVLNTDTFGGTKRLGDRLFDFSAGEWVDLFSVPAYRDIVNLIAGRSVACVDRVGDGNYGFFVANYGGPMRLYELDEDGALMDVAPICGLDYVTGGRSVVALPLVSDHMDIFTGNELGPNFLFRNRGDGTFEEIGYQAGVSDPGQNVRGVTVMDVTGDGRFDLIYGNWEGPHRIFLQTAASGFEDMSSAEVALPSRVRTVIAADFDNDGYEELFFNNIGQPNRLFGLRNGQWAALDIGDAAEPSGLGTGAAVGDFDGDGRLELIVAHGESHEQPLALYHSPDNGYGWLRVLPLTKHGAPARGAVVTLRDGERTQKRVIDAGSGYLCQMEPVAHFGLGDEQGSYQIEIHWTDGTVHQMTDVSSNQMIRVPHPNT
jgi:hypothetical protein